MCVRSVYKKKMMSLCNNCIPIYSVLNDIKNKDIYNRFTIDYHE